MCANERSKESMKSLDLLAIGDANIDLLLQVPRFGGLDDEVEVERYLRLPGGDAANTAAAASKLGLDASLLACVGKDEDGAFLVKSLQGLGIRTDLIGTTSEDQTGLVVGAVRSDGQRNLYQYKGANRFRSIGPDLAEKMAEFGAVHICDPSPDEVLKLGELLKSNKPAVTSLDPGTITAQRGIDPLRPLLSVSTVLFVNDGELKKLSGCDPLEAALAAVMASGPQIVVVKQGSQGSLVAHGHERLQLTAYKVNALDSTGAGDAFDAGFLYGLIKGFSLSEAGRFANAVGALSTRALGAQSSQPDLQEVELLIKGESL